MNTKEKIKITCNLLLRMKTVYLFISFQIFFFPYLYMYVEKKRRVCVRSCEMELHIPFGNQSRFFPCDNLVPTSFQIGSLNLLNDQKNKRRNP